MAMKTPTTPGDLSGAAPSLTDILLGSNVLDAMIDVVVATRLGKLTMPAIEVYPRSDNGMWAIRVGRERKTLKTRDPAEAQRAKSLKRVEVAAELMAGAIPRLAPVEKALEHLDNTAHLRSKASNKANKDALARIAPFYAGKRIRELDDAWVKALLAALEGEFSYGSLFRSLSVLKQAIDGWCASVDEPSCRAFAMPPAPPPRQRVFTPAEIDRMLRYCRGTEFYDPKTRAWSPVDRNGRAAQPRNLYLRKVGERLLMLGLITGSRGGCAINVVYGPSFEYPFFDLDKGRFHRLPLGHRGSRQKRWPIVALSPQAIATVRAWREADGPDARFCIGTQDDGPYACVAAQIFRQILTAVGIGTDACYHTLRHTVVTHLLLRGVSPKVVCAIVGMTLSTLERHYDHCMVDDVQPIGHPVIDRFVEVGLVDTSSVA